MLADAHTTSPIEQYVLYYITTYYVFTRYKITACSKNEYKDHLTTVNRIQSPPPM